ncbi:MAG: autotransporter outer membrane beta-barrel domain-containing protein, partial [Rhodospirillaceae bacterium]|nr:autotransporter outer membrane beta-barrel domain-containing protein [Rhodospirillaceae bacterium]
NQSKVSLIGNEPLNASTVSFSSGSALKFDLPSIAPTGTVLKATGAVNFAAGSTVTAAFTGVLTSVQTYSLIQAGALTSGSGVPLSQFATAPSSFLNSTQFMSTANSLTLIVRPKTAAELELGPNATTVYNLFATTINKDTGLATAISAQGSKETFTRALRQLLPDTSGATQQVALNTQDMATGQIRRRLVGVAKNGNPTHASGDTASFWAQAIGDYSQQSAQGEQQGFDAWGLGIAFGSDMPVGDRTNIGFAFTETWHSADLGVSRVSPTQFYSTLGYVYGRSDFGNAYVQAMGGGGVNSYNQARHVTFDTTSRIANGYWKGYQYGGAVEAGYISRWDDYSITPYLRGSYLKMHENGYTETGGGAAVNLAVGEKNPEASTRGSVGFTFDRNFPVYFDSYIEAEFRADYTREFTNGATTLNASFASGSPTFVNVGNPREPNRFKVGFGIAGKDSYSSISLDYDVEGAKGYVAHIAGVTARFRF